MQKGKKLLLLAMMASVASIMCYTFFSEIGSTKLLVFWLMVYFFLYKGALWARILYAFQAVAFVSGVVFRIVVAVRQPELMAVNFYELFFVLLHVTVTLIANYLIWKNGDIRAFLLCRGRCNISSSGTQDEESMDH